MSRSRSRRTPLAFLLLIGLFLRGLDAEEGVTRAEFWIDLDAIPAAGDSWPLGTEEATGRLLEEAAFVFSGMFEGFEFAWTPRDRTRHVEERFELRSLETIRASDPRLLQGSPRRKDQRLFAYVEFHPDEASRRAREIQQGAGWKSAQGVGHAELIRGFSGRRAAYEDSLRAGIEALLRGLEPNRPRLVRGRVAFATTPSIGIVEGRYTVTARLRVEVLEVLRYEFSY